MPRYYFHIVNSHFQVDTDGVELADIAAVRAEAIAAASAILRDASLKGWAGNEWQMHVVDEQKNTVMKLTFDATEYR